MLKKIHSNRGPGDTLFSEIKKEFAQYFRSAGSHARRFALAYPRFCYGLMAALLLASAVFSFAPSAGGASSQDNPPRQLNPIGAGFSRIAEASGRIRQTLALKALVDSICSKRHLSAKDSSLLDSALERLARINKPLK